LIKVSCLVATRSRPGHGRASSKIAALQRTMRDQTAFCQLACQPDLPWYKTGVDKNYNINSNDDVIDSE
jgi:hypothetical protein